MDRGERTKDVLTCTALAVATAVAYAPALRGAFLTYDDDVYVTANAHVQHGLTGESLRWAGTATHAANWHPLTWISHMIDWSLFGAVPAGHHAVSVAIHVVSTVLLYRVLRAATGTAGRSAFVAGAFGLHPLHVESVAWISERKDVLSGLCFMLTLAGYVAYARKPGAARYLLALAAFACGLAAKPMLVTLPVILVLLDAWPLGRRAAHPFLEKAPFVALAAASAAITILAQSRGRTVAPLEVYPPVVRIENALASIAGYLAKTVWPVGLSVAYPHPGEAVAPIRVVAGAAAVVLPLILAWRWRAVRPWLLVGWCWYLTMLVPVLGLVQVGSQGMADRYTYLPLIGVFIVLAWLGAEAGALRGPGRAVPVVAIAVLGCLAVATRVQAGTWRDTKTLFTHALAVDPDNAVAHQNLGVALALEGRIDEAIGELEVAVRLKPRFARAWENLARLQVIRGRYREALNSARRANDADPSDGDAHVDLAAALCGLGEFAHAWEEVRAARQLGVEPPASLLARLPAE